MKQRSVHIAFLLLQYLQKTWTICSLTKLFYCMIIMLPAVIRGKEFISIKTKNILLALLLLLRLPQVFYIFLFLLEKDLLLLIMAYIAPSNSKAYYLIYFTFIVIWEVDQPNVLLSYLVSFWSYQYGYVFQLQMW